MSKIVKFRSIKTEDVPIRVDWSQELGELKKGMNFIIDLKHWDSVRSYINRQGFQAKRMTLDNKTECKVWVI